MTIEHKSSMLPVLLIAAFAVGTVACSSKTGGSTTPTTAPRAVTTIVPTTMLPAATVPPTTGSPEPPTTTLPTTVTTGVREQVIAAYEDYLAVYATCMVRPAECDVAGLALPGSAASANLAAYFRRIAEQGLQIKAGPNDRIVYEGVTEAADGTAALVTCFVDGGVIFDPRSPDDPSDDAIVNDKVVYGRGRWTFSLSDGALWRLTTIETIETFQEDRCAAP